MNDVSYNPLACLRRSEVYLKQLPINKQSFKNIPYGRLAYLRKIEFELLKKELLNDTFNFGDSGPYKFLWEKTSEGLRFWDECYQKIGTI